jgi:hypothetical protein
MVVNGIWRGIYIGIYWSDREGNLIPARIPFFDLSIALFPSDSNIALSDLLLLSQVLRTLQFRSLGRLLLLSVQVLSSKDGLHYFYLRAR